MSTPRDHRRPRPKAAGKFGPPKDKIRQNAKYIHGVTEIDRSKGTSMPQKGGKDQELIPSLLIGEKRCRACYTDEPSCECGKPLFDPDVNVWWTESSSYMDLGFAAVRKCEDIAMEEARRLGMSCVVLRSEHHNTATEFNQTGRKTGRYIAADWHITLSLGDAKDKLLLQGHCYLFMGKGTEVPQCKLAPGNRKILEPHEKLEQLTLEEAPEAVYWGINGSCGWVFIDGRLPPTIE